ncbi:hypothetical protein [Methylobacterium isbiliense]|uniref:Uncharacterized protein n=1 Tax=Methylobacterium isbiliense TaxID=315478 RepID=A0ABQ4SJ67_9HYPH|nr:hypothetical protein [Methylobacterium isbiliense]MDN3625794.1 hypothetical protein [Methylobacterium isbiliense]GJE02545.1 hypothetical protein GMJLKIPL_4494 [Methylobacterium isbiliense]
MIVFTICSANFMSYALTLYETISAHEADLTFYLLLCDHKDSIDPSAFDFEIIYIEDLGVPNFDMMRENYSITELNTSLKPFMFLYLFDRHPGEHVAYFDPDIMVCSPLIELKELMHEGAPCILTPHITEPAEFADMNDGMFLIYGIYNLGFCCLADTPEVRRVVAWWSRRLETECIIDLPRGRFVDQKWADLLPAMIGGTAILRHPGYNAAYWNLSQRRLAKCGTQWRVNQEPLRFFHFSGNLIEDVNVFSRHSHEFNVHSFGSVGNLLAEYRSLIYKNGHDFYSGLDYGFNWSGSSGRNEHTLLEIFASRPKAKAPPHLPLRRLDAGRELPPRVRAVREEAEGRVRQALLGDEPPTGYCIVCDGRTRFRASGEAHCEPSGGRQGLVCSACGFDVPVRLGLHACRQLLSRDDTAVAVVAERGRRIEDALRARLDGGGNAAARSICLVDLSSAEATASDLLGLSRAHSVLIVVDPTDETEALFARAGLPVALYEGWSEACLYMLRPTRLAIVGEPSRRSTG